MYLDEILAAQKRGEARGIVSICSAHPWVLKAAMRKHNKPLLIETTCNQVNQYGGYTGMTPDNFVKFINSIADAEGFPREQIILGGDHLGPGIWKNEPVAVAMEKAKILVQEYVQAGFIKIHLDTSMRLADDPSDSLSVEICAQRAAILADRAENSSVRPESLRYVIGTDVPEPGGVKLHREEAPLTTVESAMNTIETTRQAFWDYHLDFAWERVCALVVQPGVEFGDDFVLPYNSKAAGMLSKFIESQPIIYEVHSTDYQKSSALCRMVQDHFAILKVGPALTNAYREAIFWLAWVENDLIPKNNRSNLITILDVVMMEHPEHWHEYYQGDKTQLAKKRRSSLCDRIRYYWSEPRVQQALNKLLCNLNGMDIEQSLMKINEARAMTTILGEKGLLTSEQVILENIQDILERYAQASGR